MNKTWTIIIALFIIIVIGVAALVLIPSPTKVPPAGEVTTTPTATTTPPWSLDDTIRVTWPPSGGPATIISPVTIAGEARGSWFFEASAPVSLVDSKGKVIATGTAKATGDWQTSDYVPFTAKITFPKQPAGSTGRLILKNDNPSGDPNNDKELDIAVQF